MIKYDLSGASDPDLQVFKGVTTVIHLVGIISETRENTFEKTHVLTTKRLLSAASQCGVNRFVHMSALGTRPNAVSEYHKTKWRAEQLVRESNLQYTIFRPSLIYGPNDHLVSLFSKLSRFTPVLALPPTGLAEVQPVFVHDVAHAFSQSVRLPRTAGKTYDLCGPEKMAFKEFLSRLLKISRRKRMIVEIPRSLAFLQAIAAEKSFPLFNVAPPLTRDQLIMLNEDNTGDFESAVHDLGLQGTPLSEGLKRSLSE